MSKNKKIITLYGHATEYDKYNKMHIMFPTCYSKEQKDTNNTKYVLEAMDLKFTRAGGYSPVSRSGFVVKTNSKSFVGDNLSYKDCISQNVVVEAEPQQYDYGGDKYGWYLKMYSIRVENCP